MKHAEFSMLKSSYFGSSLGCLEDSELKRVRTLLDRIRRCHLGTVVDETATYPGDVISTLGLFSFGGFGWHIHTLVARTLVGDSARIAAIPAEYFGQDMILLKIESAAVGLNLKIFAYPTWDMPHLIIYEDNSLDGSARRIPIIPIRHYPLALRG